MTLSNKAWNGVFEMPLAGRTSKPRNKGLTMVIDKGLGLRALADLVEVGGDYIDIIKFTFGTSAFYERELIQKKNEMIKASQIFVMPGGTFLEVSVWQGGGEGYLKRAKELGFTAIEVSDGTIDMERATRRDVIRSALDMGLKVITEAGKKDPAEALPVSLIQEIIHEDIANGAFKVIIEAREAGKGVGIFDKDGRTKSDEVERIVAGVSDTNLLIWEAPMKNQQQDLILRFGPNVNLGNIPPDDVLALEALRQGVRGDTLKRAYLEKKEWR